MKVNPSTQLSRVQGHALLLGGSDGLGSKLCAYWPRTVQRTVIHMRAQLLCGVSPG
jgi:hypothetical protein